MVVYIFVGVAAFVADATKASAVLVDAVVWTHFVVSSAVPVAFVAGQ